MTELIKIITNEKGIQLASARELHQFLESKQDFSTWIKARIDKYGFVAGIDFTLHNFMEDKVWKHDYILTLDAAKELAMVEGNEKSRQVRRYFIEYKKKLREVVSNQQLYIPKTLPEALRAYADEVEKNERLKLEGQNRSRVIPGVNGTTFKIVLSQACYPYEPKVSYYDQILASTDMVTITQIAKDYGIFPRALNKLLSKLGVQSKQSNRWLVYKKYAKLGYTKSKTVVISLS